VGRSWPVSARPACPRTGLRDDSSIPRRKLLLAQNLSLESSRAKRSDTSVLGEPRLEHLGLGAIEVRRSVFVEPAEYHTTRRSL
jgi:hypothetical protein